MPFSFQVAQQANVCKGIVKDASGQPVIGASVIVKGKKNGVATDVDGRFSLNNVKAGETIHVSYIGYEPAEVQYTGAPVDITLKENSKSLNELVESRLERGLYEQQL